MAMNPRLLRPLASGFRFNPANLTLVFDTRLEPANNTVSVPISGANPNVTINWGDGTSETHTTTGFKTKTYATPGVKVVQISGTMTRLNYDTGASTTNNKAKLVRCLSFGNIGLTSLDSGFRNCPNLIQCPASLPTTSNVTNISTLFSGCTNFNSPGVSTWNTSEVVSMSQVFGFCTVFNQPLAGWNTAKVQNMLQLFLFAPAFNQPIGGWNTADVTNMGQIFSGATAFNQDISGWTTSAVTSMFQMFANASAFNQPIGSWTTANVTNMQSMFQNCTAFNQDISGWNTAKVTNMLGVFSGASAFNADISGWNTAAVNTMGSMFQNANAFNRDISNWDIRKVTTMTTMFSGSTWGTANYDAALNAWADLADADLTIGTTSNTSQAITAFATLSSGTQTRVTSNGHGLVAGSRVNISGTTNYNGDYNVLAAAVNTFDIAQAFVANDATGTIKHRRSRNITASFGANKYSAGAPTTARGVLTTTYDWSITDGGQV
jgi:surface protein